MSPSDKEAAGIPQGNRPYHQPLSHFRGKGNPHRRPAFFFLQLFFYILGVDNSAWYETKSLTSQPEYIVPKSIHKPNIEPFKPVVLNRGPHGPLGVHVIFLGVHRQNTRNWGSTMIFWGSMKKTNSERSLF